MPLSDTDGLLPATRNAFGEPVLFLLKGAAPVSFVGRFRIDPYDVPFPGSHEGLNTTQTWLYCDRRDIPWPRKPGSGDWLVIRGEIWEVVQLDYDDLGEHGYRLLKMPRRPTKWDDGTSIWDTGNSIWDWRGYLNDPPPEPAPTRQVRP